ncbi:MAG: S8 family serine peptidase, partial [Thermoplasmata archaeon]|nr:S8 family serine peptidase [Thermoplasmata archaeon]
MKKQKEVWEMKQSRRAILSVVLVIGMMLMSSLQVVGLFDPNDPADDNEQYNHEQIDAELAWDPTGEGTFTNSGTNDIVVAVLDSGLNIDHQDIPTNMLWTNRLEDVEERIADHAPGERDVDDDNDGGEDFNDPQIVNKNYNGVGYPLGGWDGIADYEWDGTGWALLPGRDPGGNGDDLGDYDLAMFDDDEDGNIDDIHGYDFEHDSPDYDAISFHGTGTIGVLASTIHNNLGIAGMAQISIMVLKVGDSGPNRYAVEDALRYAIDKGADVISMSWGIDQRTQTDVLLEEAYDDGIVLFAASGNGEDFGWVGQLNNVQYPASNEHVIAVGASEPNFPNDPDANEHRTDYTDYGPELELLAPGGTGNGNPQDIWLPWGPGNTAYEWQSGTSFATPLVAGVAALLLSYRPSLTSEEIRAILTGTATDITDANGARRDQDALPGRDFESGFGEVNAIWALSYAIGIRNKWYDGSAVQVQSVATGVDHQSSIALDSEGYSHIVWIDTTNGPFEVFYASMDPTGTQWCPPTSCEPGSSQPHDSSYPDIFVDKDEKIHISWIDHEFWYGIHWFYVLRYTMLDTDGSLLIPPRIVDLHDVNE